MAFISAADRERFRLARDQMVRIHGADPNVNGVALGLRHRDGRRADEPVVAVYVSRKRPPGLVARDRLLPSSLTVEGSQVPIDVVQAGPFYALGSRTLGLRAPAPSVLEHTERIRPVRTGSSVAHVDVTAGTMGCLVRDNTDDSLQLLSNNHVLANVNQAEVGDAVLQPGPADGGADPDDRVATLTRWIEIDADGNRVDCAIAAPIEDDLVSEEVMDDQMDPVAPNHQAVGLLFAGDCTGRVFGCRMAGVVDELDVTLVAGDDAVAEPDVDMVVEKVGRTTEYTSSVIERVDAEITVDFGDFDAAFIECFEVPGLGHPGDSGSVICVGGDGETHTNDRCPGCLLAGPLGDKYDLPLAGDVEFADRVRDEFLSLTETGRLLIRVFYVNQDMVRGRVEEITVSDTEKAYARTLYDKWRDFAQRALDDPEDPSVVVTQEMLDDYVLALYGLAHHMSDEEYNAGAEFAAIIQELIGQTYQQVLSFLAAENTYDRVDAILRAVPTLDTALPFDGSGRG